MPGFNPESGAPTSGLPGAGAAPSTQVRVFSLGGIGSPCCCGGCSVTFCAKSSVCKTGTPIPGVTFTVLSGMTVVATGITGPTGCVILSIPSAGTYTVTTSGGGIAGTSGSHALTCGGDLTVTSNTLASGFGCCSGYGVPLPLTLFASVCGAMATLTATVSGGSITFWGGFAVVTSAGVGVLSACTPSVCGWDGVTTTTGTINLGINLYCNGASPPQVVFSIDYVYTGSGAWAFMPASCTFTGSCIGSGRSNMYYNSGCSTFITSTSGTWGPTVSLTSVVGTYVSGPVSCSLTSGGCAGAPVVITS